MCALTYILSELLQIYVVIVILAIIFGWLVLFQVINPQNRFVNMVMTFLGCLTEPALGFIRRYIPTIGMFDLSPVVLILGIYALRWILRTQIGPFFCYGY